MTANLLNLLDFKVQRVEQANYGYQVYAEVPNQDKKSVAHYLYNLQGKPEVQYVAMSMWTPRHDVVQAVLPDAGSSSTSSTLLACKRRRREGRKSLREQLTLKLRRALRHGRFVLLECERDLKDKETRLLEGGTKNTQPVRITKIFLMERQS